MTISNILGETERRRERERQRTGKISHHILVDGTNRTGISKTKDDGLRKGGQRYCVIFERCQKAVENDSPILIYLKEIIIYKFNIRSRFQSL